MTFANVVIRDFLISVMFRTGVSTKSPEGARWNPIQIPNGCEVAQISVGPTGLLWAALIDGRALIRTGVTRDNLQGETWVEVRSPADNLRICQVSVGICAVWAGNLGITPMARLPCQDAYTSYEQAIDTTSWIHTGEARVSAGSTVFVDCILQLEWVQTIGTLTILNPDGATNMVRDYDDCF
ncbi:hypothetical protein NQ317_016553 [Molorchus minor]|uniref:Uncharacterized protein n=1 Tax=Molorchus minor TaxID=1323400 RepID=A0ABQ9IZ54_9CUCU|nr:hypothetical protein NQ317_016553 [Molorchus minor]